jgi:HAE1 family hydrophobic/amphiphilic exporter-1
LRNISATIIPSLALPVSIVGTFGVMDLLGYSLDNLSLMALTLSVGFVVDDAIVMLENIVRHVEMGKPPSRAAHDASKEVAFTIVSMTISLAAVFIPVLFMGGLIGRLLHEFAVTIASAILVSGLVSVSLTPMLCSRFLNLPSHQQHGMLYCASERVFNAVVDVYERSLQWTLRFRGATMAASALLLAGTAYLFVQMPKGFLPSEDINRLMISTEAEQGITYTDMLARQKEISGIVHQQEGIEVFNAGVGISGPLNQGIFAATLKPRSERRLSVDEIIAQLRPKLAQVVGMRVFMSNPPTINVGGGQGRSQYQLALQDIDTSELYTYAPILEERIRNLPGFEDVTSDLQLKNPQVRVQIDRDRLATLGLTADQVETALYSAYGSRQVSTIYAPNNQYQVILQVAPEFQQNTSALSLLYVRARGGALVPLSTVSKVTPETAPLTIAHLGQLPAVTISFNLHPGVALSSAVDQVLKAAAETLPAAITPSFQGAAQAYQESLKGLGLVLAMAILVIYIVLGILYESFTLPITILSGLPSATLGALLTLLLFKIELNLYAFVGVIMLIGLVKKNGIMMVDFAADVQAREGKSPIEAIVEACRIRFRPIMMTTMAALVGTLPIAMGYGAGGESRRPLGLAVVGGLVVSQLLTLYLTPVYYVVIEHARMRLASRRKRPNRHERYADFAPLG